MSSTSTLGSSARAGVDWRRPEFVLTALGFVGFVTLAVRLRTISPGLPAHPLFVHVPVVLIPVSVIGALACVARPRWLERYGTLLCLVAIVAMSSIFLAMQAGAALEGALHLSGRAARLIDQHSSAAHILAFVFIAFTAVLILTFSAQRISGGMPTGLAVADRLLGSRATCRALRLGLVALSVLAAYYVYRVGDLGAQAVWAGRLRPGGN
jgi:uncharacterized membrane protein